MQASRWTKGVLLAGAAALLLAGCGRRGDHQAASGRSDGADAAGPAAGGDGGSSDAERLNGKLNAYIEGFNTLIGTFGLSEQFAQYQGQQIARKTVNDPAFVNVGWVDNALGDLQKARRTPGRAPELDAAGDRELAVLTPLVAQLKGLSVYYTSRGQLADGFARGKREDPQVIARFQGAIAALPALSDAIERVQERRDTAELARLKSSGDVVGYDHALAMQKAKQLLAISASPADLRDPAKQSRGDQLVAGIQAALADEAQAHARTANSIEHGARDSMYDSSADRLQGFVGAYRNLRQNPSPFGRQAMISSYNDAVEQANSAP